MKLKLMRNELDKKELIIITLMLTFMAALVITDHLYEPFIVISIILLTVIVIIFGIILYLYRKKKAAIKPMKYKDSE